MNKKLNGPTVSSNQWHELMRTGGNESYSSPLGVCLWRLKISAGSLPLLVSDFWKILIFSLVYAFPSAYATYVWVPEESFCVSDLLKLE